MHQARNQHVGDHRDGKHEVVVLQLGAQGQISDTRQPDRNRGDIGQRQRSLRQLDPVEGHQPDHLGKGNRHDDKIRAADAKRQQPHQIPAQRGDDDRQHEADNRRPWLVNHAQVKGQAGVETKRRQRADVSANAEECDVAETELAGEAEQQIEAHRADDEDAGRDQRVHQIRIAQPQRHGCECNDRQNSDPCLHPTRSERAKSPVGLKIRTAMMIRKPIASRYPDET